MVLVTCHCLNIKIHIRGELHELQSTRIDCNEEFFRSDLKEATLDADGIKQEHEYLLEKQQVIDWLVFRCLVCGHYTHAIDSTTNTDSLLINQTLLSDPTEIARLYGSSNYSPSFRIVVSEPDDSVIAQPSCYNLDFLQHLHLDVERYIAKEEADMEERIRKFEENERALLQEKQARSKVDKKRVISLVFRNSAQNANTTPSPKKSLTHSMSTPTSLYEQNRNRRDFKNNYSIPDNRNRIKSFESDPLDENDELFHFEPSDEAYAMSEDDGQDTDDSSVLEQSSSPSLYSTSVPVSVPLWKAKDSSPAKRIDEDEDEMGHPDINQIHASMKALAKSVHDSSKEIFGDLPRPRMHTFSGRMTKR